MPKSVLVIVLILLGAVQNARSQETGDIQFGATSSVSGGVLVLQEKDEIHETDYLLSVSYQRTHLHNIGVGVDLSMGLLSQFHSDNAFIIDAGLGLMTAVKIKRSALFLRAGATANPGVWGGTLLGYYVGVGSFIMNGERGGIRLDLTLRETDYARVVGFTVGAFVMPSSNWSLDKRCRDHGKGRPSLARDRPMVEDGCIQQPTLYHDPT